MPTNGQPKVWATNWATTWSKPVDRLWMKDGTHQTLSSPISKPNSRWTGLLTWVKSGPMPVIRLFPWQSGSDWRKKSPPCHPRSPRTNWSKKSMTIALPWGGVIFPWIGAWASTWHLPRWCLQVIPFVCLVKTQVVELSPTGMPLSMIKAVRNGTRVRTCPWKTSVTSKHRLWSSTPSSPRKLCWGLSMVTHPMTPVLWSFGKPSLVISPTVRKW